MNKELYISANPHETRIALSEDGELTEVYYEREREYSLAGSIYKGRVTRVLPGMQSAFVDIGLERDAFLYVTDFFEDMEEFDELAEGGAPVPSRRPAPPAEGATAPPAAEGGAAPPAEAGGDAAAPAHREGRRRRGRRGRGRHREQGGIPDSKFASTAAPDAEAAADTSPEAAAAPPTPAERAARPEPIPAAAPAPVHAPSRQPSAPPSHARPSREAYPFTLPGESLAKYRHAPAPAAEAGESEPSEPEQEAEAGQEFDRSRIQPDSPRETFAAAQRFERSAEAEEEIPRDAESAARADSEPSAASTEDDGISAQPAPEAGENEAADTGAGGEAEVEAASDQAQLRPPAETARFEARAGRRRRGGRGRAPRRLPDSAGDHAAEPAVNGAGDDSERAHGPKLINEMLHSGQEILVQIAKEPLGTKGARITSHLALPGRYLVYMPTVRHIGVSRKIASDEERARLKRLLVEHTQDLPGGFIVRTAGQSASDEDLIADIRFLSHLWNDIRQHFDHAKAPALLHHDLGLVERTLRDQLSSDFTHIWIDSEDQYQAVVRFVGHFMPDLASRVRLFTRDEPIFDHFGIQEEIDKALKSKVWLKSGGYIVINQTEALVAIDVNTGKYVGKSNRLEDTIVKINVDAIREIVRQIRLRDLGGIIVVDFIDMDERKNRQKVMQALEEAMRADRAPSKVLAFNDFGLVALTRKRVKQSLERTLGTPCPYCAGVGLVKSITTVCNEIYTEVRKMSRSIDRDDMVLRVNPEVGKALKAKNAKLLNELEQLTGKMIAIKADPMVHQEQFEIF